ncbi:MAG: NAD(+) synthase, partial [Actinobacteria bacterium]|nr:NAD(+) synthase [Actinomycetota bacterium]
MPTLRVGLAQLNTVVGDIDGNASRIIELIAQASASGCDVVAFPELAITGYPPEDLLLRSGFVADVGRALERIVASTGTCTAIVGYVEQGSETRSGNDAHDGETTGARTASRSALYNAAAVCRDGSLISNYRKRELPNYSVFDEARYFVPGEGPLDVFDVNGVSVGVSICEDAWTVGGPIAELGRQNTQLVVNINASPFNVGKSQERAAVIAERAKEASATIVYVNQVGGQDELVFDGDSLVMSPVGSLLARAPRFIEDLYVIDLEFSDVGSVISQSTITPLGVAKPLSEEAEVWEALVLATRDFVAKNRFSDVVIGLSGGVDSAIVAAIAVDAVGADHVHGVLMPSRYSSDHSISDAVVLAENLGVDYCTIAIEPGHVALMEMLASSYDGKTIGLAEENLQSRL